MRGEGASLGIQQRGSEMVVSSAEGTRHIVVEGLMAKEEDFSPSVLHTDSLAVVT
jgi:hypothetical protein